MEFSDKGLSLLKSLESCKLTSYKDSAGIWTIGYGSIVDYLGFPIKEGDTWNQETADDELMLECGDIVDFLSKLITVYLTQNQFDALVILTYNIGKAGFKSSTLLSFINNRKVITEDLFTRWDKIHVDGKLVELPGLLNRRKKEFQLWSSKDE